MTSMSFATRLLARTRPSVYGNCASQCRTIIISRKKIPARSQTPRVAASAASAAPSASAPAPTAAAAPAAAPAFPGKDLLLNYDIEEESKFAHEDLLDAFNELDDDADSIINLKGLGSKPFDQTAATILLAPLEMSEIEITPEGLLYLPEIRYRRILNRAFGPGGWGLAPRGKPLVTGKQVSREYVLVCLGRAVSVARGEREFFADSGVHTAIEGCKSNALMRCCKDLGIASELWDPTFIRKFKSKYCEMSYNEKRRKSLWKLK